MCLYLTLPYFFWCPQVLGQPVFLHQAFKLSSHNAAHKPTCGAPPHVCRRGSSTLILPQLQAMRTLKPLSWRSCWRCSGPLDAGTSTNSHSNLCCNQQRLPPGSMRMPMQCGLKLLAFSLPVSQVGLRPRCIVWWLARIHEMLPAMGACRPRLYDFSIYPLAAWLIYVTCECSSACAGPHLAVAATGGWDGERSLRSPLCTHDLEVAPAACRQ